MPVAKSRPNRLLRVAVASTAALFACAGAALAGEPAPGLGTAAVAAMPVNTGSQAPGDTLAGADCKPVWMTTVEPFDFTVDGQPADGSKRCAVAAPVPTDVQIRYDGLSNEPRLNVVASPDAALKGSDVTFKTYSNYALLIARGEIRIFQKGDTTRQAPLAVVPLKKGLARWQVPKDAGDLVTYVLRVYDAGGRFDETAPKILDLSAVRAGTPSAQDLMAVYNGNALEVRNIPITGGAVLVSGHHVPSGQVVTVMGLPVPVDAKGDFAIRQFVSTGEHQISVAIGDPRGLASVYTRTAYIPDHDYFYVALADLSAGKGTSSGSMALLNPDNTDKYNDKVFVNGRVAFYLKGKIDGETLLTLSADTRDQPVQHMFSNFDSKDPTYLLRNLDPNRYYPVYGDDSTLTEDAPTRGKFYVRLERGDSSIMWGNFKTTVTGTEFLRYERGLYGARAQTKTAESTSFGERRGQAEVFAAEPGTLGARDVFRGTGGTLYYTSRQNITQGSERITLESRDSNTGLVLKTQALAATQDYDINYLQGRVILKNPLSSFGASDMIVQAGGLSGVDQYVVINYEYAPSLQANTDKAFGGRTSYWVNDHVQVGVTGYSQTAAAEKLAIGGIDATFRTTAASYVKIEGARSTGPGSGENVSIDGGYTFSNRASSGAPGWARKIEAAADLAEFIKGADGRLSAYWKQKDQGFAGPGELTLGRGGMEMGVKSVVKIDERWSEKTKIDGKQDEFRTYTVAEQNVTYKFNDYWKGTAGVRADNNSVAVGTASPILNQTGSRTDLAFRLDYDSHKDWGTYGYLQGTAERSGQREANNRIGFGGNWRINENTKATAEVSEGNGGFGAKVGTEYKVDEKRSSYLNYALDPDRTDIISRGGTGTLTGGTRERFSDSFSVFGEERLKYGGGFSGLTHAYGLEFLPAEHWKAGIVVETGRLSDPYQGDVQRTAVSPSIGYTHGGLTTASRFEYRHDDITSLNTTTGAAETVRDTYLMNNSIANKLNTDWRYLGRLNGSYSVGAGGTFYQGNYLEAVNGLAYRPVNNDRLNALFKYTYFYNVPTAGQNIALPGSADYSQQSHVIAVDAAYDLNSYVTVGVKYALRTGSIKDNTTGGPWLDSTVELLIGRIDYHIVKEWDLSAELRTLVALNARDQQTGALVGVYRHLGDNFKFGVGYNFTHFSDDLTNLSGKNQGVFVNAIGKF